jgi:hypothetical protein
MSFLKLLIPFDMEFYNNLDMPTANNIVRNGFFKENGLSSTSKLNCFSWGIPMEYCKTGSELALMKNTICNGCTCNHGKYTIPHNRTVYDQRFNAWREQPHWIEAITFLIRNKGYTIFRWFDSGDLQEEYMLLQFIKIANMLPKKRFWLPTQEREMVANVIRDGYEIPKNMTIRLSSIHINGDPPKDLAKELNSYPNVHGYIGTSRVLTKQVFENYNGFTCPSSRQGGKCLDCTLCWEAMPDIPYLKK